MKVGRAGAVTATVASGAGARAASVPAFGFRPELLPLFLVALGATFLPLDLTIAATLLVTRDVAVGGLREGLSLSGRALPVASLGKLKTVVTMIAIGAAIALQIARLLWPEGTVGAGDAARTVIEVATRFTLWSAVILAYWSAVEYFIAAFKK